MMLKLAALGALVKPHILLLSVLAAAGGAALGAGVTPALWLWTLLGTAFQVAGANALNMVLERDLDRLMVRTAHRPLPSGRLSVGAALALGLSLSLLALLTLLLGTNPVTALLGLLGLLVYIGLYTPWKRRTPAALLPGAAAGALPPLMGWTAVTGDLGQPGLLLFAVIFIWQVPHFLSISLSRREDYTRAGFRTASQVQRSRTTRWQALLAMTALVPVSLLLLLVDGLGWIYASAAMAGSLGLLVPSLMGLRSAGQAPASTPEAADQKWGYRVFRLSLIFPPVLFLGIIVDMLV